MRFGAATSTLGIEGTETALAAMQIAGMPVWASLGANRLDVIWIPSAIRFLDIYGDPDEPGRRAVIKALDHHRIGRRVRGCLPPIAGDWNDYLMKEAVPR